MIFDSKNREILQISPELANSNILGFLIEILNLAQCTLDSFYTDCIILTQPPDDVEVISLNDYLQPDRLLSEWQTSEIYQKSHIRLQLL